MLVIRKWKPRFSLVKHLAFVQHYAREFGITLMIKMMQTCFILMKSNVSNFLLVTESRLLVLLGKVCLACPVTKKIRCAVRVAICVCFNSQYSLLLKLNRQL